MPSVTFLPAGSQLDDDPIQDLQLNVGDRFQAVFELDTSGLDANLQLLDIRNDLDFSELNITAIRTEFDQTAFPNFSSREPTFGENFASVVFERTGPPGALPDTISVIVEGELTALGGLVNDGQPDLGITVVKAIDANGNAVTTLFDPLAQAIDVQPLPVVGVDLEPTFIIEGGAAQSLILNLSEPAPPGGLVVDLLVSPREPETMMDAMPRFDQSQNLAGAEEIIENGQIIGRLTVAEGATQASVAFVAVTDDEIESFDTFSFALLPRDGYAIDPDNNRVTSAIIDDSTVIEGTPKDDVLSGTFGADAIFGADGDDAIFGNGGEDALFGQAGDDLIVGASRDDFLDGGVGNDRLSGRSGNDFLWGDDGRDRLLGNDGLDTLIGGDGEDTLVGGQANDSLSGGSGDDRLIGADINSPELGQGEQDTLTGGTGVDTFVLGVETGVLYDDGDRFTFGDADFARITDFDVQEDIVQLFGFADQYRLDFLANSPGRVDAKLIYDSGISASSELIAVLENVSTDLSISDSAFTFV